MVLHTGSVGDRLADAFTGWGPFRLLGNPFIAAMIVTVIAAIVLFKVLDKNGHFSKLPWVAKIRGMLFLFLGASVVLSLHYYALDRDLSAIHGVGSQNEIVTELHAAQSMPHELGLQTGDHIPVGSRVVGHPAPPPVAPPLAAVPQYVGQGEPDLLSLSPLALRPLGQ
jgi:hypothetical protein